MEAAQGRSATPEARYRLGCLHIGVNDVRALDWEPEAFAADLRTVLAFLGERCERIVVLTIPVDLGRPRAGAKVEIANALIESAAAAAGATIVDLRGFRGRGVLMADHVHPTALGQVAIAERVLDRLAAEGERIYIRPRDLVFYETAWVDRLRGDATYAYRHAKVAVRSAWLRALAARSS
jgi:hypothetical protein